MGSSFIISNPYQSLTFKIYIMIRSISKEITKLAFDKVKKLYIVETIKYRNGSSVKRYYKNSGPNRAVPVHIENLSWGFLLCLYQPLQVYRLNAITSKYGIILIFGLW